MSRLHYLPLASIILALTACATKPPEPVERVVVRTVKAEPPPELVRCAHRPAGLPLDQIGMLPPEVRDGLVRIAEAFALNAQHVDRWAEWAKPGACPNP